MSTIFCIFFKRCFCNIGESWFKKYFFFSEKSYFGILSLTFCKFEIPFYRQKNVLEKEEREWESVRVNPTQNDVIEFNLVFNLAFEHFKIKLSQFLSFQLFSEENEAKVSSKSTFSLYLSSLIYFRTFLYHLKYFGHDLSHQIRHSYCLNINLFPNCYWRFS